MSVSFPALIEQYLQGVATIRGAVKGMTPEQMKARPLPEKWTTLEVIVHLSDFEPIFAERMKRIITHDRPLLMVADENLFSKDLAYEVRDAEEELTLIEMTRKQMARILKALPIEMAIKTGVHSQKGLVSLEAVLSGAVAHLNHHVKFIHEKRTALKV
jgi:hypothetical protein